MIAAGGAEQPPLVALPATHWAGSRVDAVVMINWAAWAPLLLLAFGLVGFALFDLARSEVRYLPKWAWAALCLLSVPLGAIVYLLVGRARRGP